MKQNIEIRIDTLCSKNYADFIKTKKGGFCNSCKKEVIDFSGMNDREVMTYLKDAKRRVCGRFMSSQLQNRTYLPQQSSRFPSTFLSMTALALFSLISPLQVHAQNGKSKIVQTDTIQNDRKETDTQGKLIEVKGIITHENEALPGVNVLLKGTQIGTISDINGHFVFPNKLKKGDVLLFSYLGFETREFMVKQNLSEDLKMELEMDDLILMGEVNIQKTYQGNSTLWQRLKSKFQK